MRDPTITRLFQALPFQHIRTLRVHLKVRFGLKVWRLLAPYCTNVVLLSHNEDLGDKVKWFQEILFRDESSSSQQSLEKSSPRLEKLEYLRLPLHGQGQMALNACLRQRHELGIPIKSLVLRGTSTAYSDELAAYVDGEIIFHE